MPNTKSAEKALRQSHRRRARNIARKSAYRDVVKEFRKTVHDRPKDAALMLATLQQKVDKAAKAGVIKPNKAARLKSKAARLLANATK